MACVAWRHCVKMCQIEHPLDPVQTMVWVENWTYSGFRLPFKLISRIYFWKIQGLVVFPPFFFLSGPFVGYPGLAGAGKTQIGQILRRVYSGRHSSQMFHNSWNITSAKKKKKDCCWCSAGTLPKRYVCVWIWLMLISETFALFVLSALILSGHKYLWYY